jgi:hypothetical protein
MIDEELTGRERFILHSTAILTVDLLVKRLKENPEELKDMEGLTEDELFIMMEDVRKNRCRKLDIDSMSKLYDQMREEMMLGGALYKE